MIRTILLTNGYEKGYLPKNNPEMLHPVFPAANFAIRKKVLDQVGLFDVVCKTSGEDVDLCIRVARTQWEMFFEPRAIVLHKHRTTFFGLVKQWYGYGTYHPHIFKKLVPKGMEIYYPDARNDLGWSVLRLERILGIPVPFHVLIFVTPFYFFNIICILLFAAVILKSLSLSIIAVSVGLLGWFYFSWADHFKKLFIKRDARWLVYSLIRYILNWVYVLGAFIAGLKIGIVYFDITREHVSSTEDPNNNAGVKDQ